MVVCHTPGVLCHLLEPDPRLVIHLIIEATGRFLLQSIVSHMLQASRFLKTGRAGTGSRLQPPQPGTSRLVRSIFTTHFAYESTSSIHSRQRGCRLAARSATRCRRMVASPSSAPCRRAQDKQGTSSWVRLTCHRHALCTIWCGSDWFPSDGFPSACPGANLQWVGRSSRMTVFNARACRPSATSDDLCSIVVDVVTK